MEKVFCIAFIICSMNKKLYKDLAKEFVRENLDVKLMDVNENSIEITDCDADDLDFLENAGFEVSEVGVNGFKLEVESKDSFVQSYNDWVDKAKKISSSDL